MELLLDQWHLSNMKVMLTLWTLWTLNTYEHREHCEHLTLLTLWTLWTLNNTDCTPFSCILLIVFTIAPTNFKKPCSQISENMIKPPIYDFIA